jgi:hypothetical protein
MPPGLMNDIESEKAKLDAYRPLKGAALEYLRHLYDIEITYTSNAIKGNTLSAAAGRDVGRGSGRAEPWAAARPRPLTIQG